MASVLGLGGIFFKSKDPKALREWYSNHLNLKSEDFGAVFNFSNYPEKSYNIWSPFKSDTTYFNPSQKEFMINFIVDDVDGVLKQVEQGGAEVLKEREDGEFGKFGWFIDPEGNKIELWEPNPK